MKNKKPFEDCRHFKICSCSSCPLDPAYPDRPSLPGDPEKKCGTSKAHRIEIAAKFPGLLKYEGMTVKEFTGYLKYKSLTDKERAELAARLPKKGDLVPDFRAS